MKTIFPINDDQINKNLLQGRQHLQTQDPCCISLEIQSGRSAILQTWRSSSVTSIETFYMQCTLSIWTTFADVGSVLPDQVTMPHIPSTIYYTLCSTQKTLNRKQNETRKDRKASLPSLAGLHVSHIADLPLIRRLCKPIRNIKLLTLLSGLYSHS